MFWRITVLCLLRFSDASFKYHDKLHNNYFIEQINIDDNYHPLDEELPIFSETTFDFNKKYITKTIIENNKTMTFVIVIKI
jgi:hypothetical protein